MPSFTRLTATRSDESFFLRSASAGGSSISTTSVAATIVMRSRAGDRDFASSWRSVASSPTAITRASGADSRNASDAAIVTGGP